MAHNAIKPDCHYLQIDLAGPWGPFNEKCSLTVGWLYLYYAGYFTALMHLPVLSLLSACCLLITPSLFILTPLLLLCLSVRLQLCARLSVYLPPHSLFVCLGLWAGLWQGWLWLNLPQASNGKEWDKRCHIMRALLSWLWLRVVIQNWWREELKLTSCQWWMFSKSRQASSNDNVGYAPWILTPSSILWHACWYLTQGLLLFLRDLDCEADADASQLCIALNVSPVLCKAWWSFYQMKVIMLC